MKQITASVTFLPMLEEPCTSSPACLVGHVLRLTLTTLTGAFAHHLGTFTLLAYTSTADPLALPEKWNDADPHLIDKGKVEQVRLRSFSTNVHKLEVSVQPSFPADGTLMCFPNVHFTGNGGV
jgi:mitotic spindle assembly checkpoint protein MAD2